MSETVKKRRRTFPFEMSIPLRKTITLGKGAEAVTYSEFELREPTLDEISQFVKKCKTENEVDSIKFMISIVAGIPLPVAAKIGATEYHKAQEFLVYFMTPPEPDDEEDEAAQGNEEASQ